ncbi:hypothetical protein [Streptosporangium sandarakinum]|uniref:hypothetical protein n=1 Tax=Streptosporangium sandarakinum TaxID=1260955 RepID=UPI0034298EAD
MEIKTAASLAAAALGAVVFAGAYTVPAQAASVAPVAGGVGIPLGIGNGDNDDEFFLALALQDFFDNDRRGHKDCDEDEDDD